MDESNNSIEEYIPCKSCSEWSIPKKIGKICKLCNNSGFKYNPEFVKCNSCAGPMTTKYNSNHIYGLQNIKCSGGFYSEHLSDLTNYQFNLCELCLRNLFNSFIIKPNVSSSFNKDMYENMSSYEDDKKHYDLKIWKENGGAHQAYLNEKCNAIKDCPNLAVYSLFYDDNEDFTENSFCEDCVKNLHYSKKELKPFLKNSMRILL